MQCCSHCRLYSTHSERQQRTSRLPLIIRHFCEGPAGCVAKNISLLSHSIAALSNLRAQATAKEHVIQTAYQHVIQTTRSSSRISLTRAAFAFGLTANSFYGIDIELASSFKTKSLVGTRTLQQSAVVGTSTRQHSSQQRDTASRRIKLLQASTNFK